MIRITENTIDEWLSDFSEFNFAFRTFCFSNFHAFGVHAEFTPNVLNEVHSGWKEDVADWLQHEVSTETKELSQLKITSLLLYNLTRIPFLGSMHAHDWGANQKFFSSLSGSKFDEAKKDLIDLRDLLLSFDFCIAVIDWVERNRCDRSTPYTQRLTPDMRHDMLSYLLGETKDKRALYLILKALYLREPGCHSAN